MDAICEHYLGKIPKPDAIRLLARYAFREEASAGNKRYALMIDVTNRFGLQKFEARLCQFVFKQTPPFIVGTEEYWGDEWPKRLQYLRDAYRRSERAGPDELFENN